MTHLKTTTALILAASLAGAPAHAFSLSDISKAVRNAFTGGPSISAIDISGPMARPSVAVTAVGSTSNANNFAKAMNYRTAKINIDWWLWSGAIFPQAKMSVKGGGVPNYSNGSAPYATSNCHGSGCNGG